MVPGLGLQALGPGRQFPGQDLQPSPYFLPLSLHTAFPLPNTMSLFMIFFFLLILPSFHSSSPFSQRVFLPHSPLPIHIHFLPFLFSLSLCYALHPHSQVQIDVLNFAPFILSFFTTLFLPLLPSTNSHPISHLPLFFFSTLRSHPHCQVPIHVLNCSLFCLSFFTKRFPPPFPLSIPLIHPLYPSPQKAQPESIHFNDWFD